MLTQELIIELKEILKDDFNLTLSIEEVKKIAAVFLIYFELLAKITTQKEVEKHG